MKIKIYGLQCQETERVIFNVQNAVIGMFDAPIVCWEHDIEKMKLWIGSIPVVLFDDTMKSSGSVPSTEEIKEWLKEEQHTNEKLSEEIPLL